MKSCYLILLHYLLKVANSQMSHLQKKTIIHNLYKIHACKDGTILPHVGVGSLLTSEQFIATTHNTQWLSRVVKESKKKYLLKDIITIIKLPNFT